MSGLDPARSILQGSAEGPVIATGEALSFWGGVDPATGCVIDVRTRRARKPSTWP